MQALLFLYSLGNTLGFQPFQNPPWGPSFNLNQSLISMMCNSSGVYDPVLASKFGIASFDWSNQKSTWAAAKPMTDEELLVSQARLVKAQNGAGRIFTYFNIVKALPWMSSVREKLQDPDYSGFFLKFDPTVIPHVPACDDVTGVCSVFYHDQLQSPSIAGPGRHPDGVCEGYCDCGVGVPCGEYLFDHRNGTMLQDFLISILTGPTFLGLDGGGTISGMFIDDFWCSNLLNGTGACTDPVQGPTEIDAHSQLDMGLSDNDIKDITLGWLDTMTKAQAAIVKAGGYTWSLMPGQDNANAMPLTLAPGAQCVAHLQHACTTSAWEEAPLLMGISNANTTSPLFNAELAGFLLMRGGSAYLGWGEWGMTWPWSVEVPRVFESGFWGVPSEGCKEGPQGVFTRVYPAGTVQLNCSSFVGVVPPSLF